MSANTGNEEPIDAEFEPAKDVAAPAQRAAKRGPGWLSTFSMMLVATAGGGVLGYGAARYAPEWQGTPGFEGLAGAQAATENSLNTLRTRIVELEAQTGEASAEDLQSAVKAIDTRIGTLRADIDALGDTAADTERLDRLSRRISILEAAGERDGASPEEVTRSLSALTGRLDLLSEELTALNESQGETLSATDALAAKATAVDEAIATLGTRLATLENTMKKNAAASRDTGDRLGKAALALAEIEAAARRGQPFPAALADLAAARPESSAVDALSTIAQTGAPTIETLARSFPDTATAIRKAGEAADGGGAAGLAGRIFGDAIEVRRDDERPVAGRVETAGTALESGDLGGAIAALETLEGASGAEAAAWLEQARLRRRLERSLDTLRLELMRQEP